MQKASPSSLVLERGFVTGGSPGHLQSFFFYFGIVSCGAFPERAGMSPLLAAAAGEQTEAGNPLVLCSWNRRGLCALP